MPEIPPYSDRRTRGNAPSGVRGPLAGWTPVRRRLTTRGMMIASAVVGLFLGTLIYVDRHSHQDNNHLAADELVLDSVVILTLVVAVRSGRRRRQGTLQDDDSLD